MRVAAVAGAVLAAACGGEAAPRVDPPTEPSRDLATLTARVDHEGFFEIEDATLGEAYPASPRVRALVGRFGRIDLAEPGEFRIAVRSADGSFESRTLDERLESPPITHHRVVVKSLRRRPVLDALRARARSWGDAGTSGAFARLLAGTAGPPPGTVSAMPELRGPTKLPVDVPLTVGPHEAPVPSSPGADLAEWAPAERAFARFRSVEAAYRFASEADRLAARLLAVQGDGRDWGTLRWALHDLLLPTIWRTNPGGDSGVGECAVVFETPLTRGRTEVALLLRITDAENHRMDTLAGIGQESRPDHLWRPERDPFPELRARRNFREVRADVEWVATSEDASAALHAEGVARVAADPRWRAARGDGPPPRDEAFLLYVPECVRERGSDDADGAQEEGVRARREEAGLRALAHGWAGGGHTFGTDVLGVRAVNAPSQHRLVSVRATTDGKGALVEATFVDEPSARAAEESLAAAARPLPNAGDVCRTNLRDLVPLAVCESVPAQDVAERSFVVLGWKPVCPCGGTYLVHPITRETSCTLHGSVRKPLPEPPAPGPLLRDLTREGTTVRFRWPIDWDRRE